ncbi:hypothetical protein Z950_1611 [Sulfitobacter mediterraneus KCTC 32188]|nr:hypothetical protein Z950_1611 [Sulfitobacter mediterraneus KCTC 32188]
MAKNNPGEIAQWAVGGWPPSAPQKSADQNLLTRRIAFID